VNSSAQYEAAIAGVRKQVPGASLFDAHPAFGLRRSDDDVPTRLDLHDLGLDWLRRSASEHRQRRVEWMVALLRWVGGEGDARFWAQVTETSLRDRLRALPGVEVFGDSSLAGRLDEQAVAILAQGEPSDFRVTCAGVLRVVADGSDCVGIWLRAAEAVDLRARLPHISSETPETSGDRLRRAQLLIAWRGYIRRYLMLAAGSLLAIWAVARYGHSFLELRAAAAACLGMVVALALTWPVDRWLIAPWRNDSDGKS
jgi:hypothetical protein